MCCCAPIPVHVLIMYSIQFCPSCSQLLSYCLTIIQEVMEILLLNLGKAAILSLLSKRSYWIHSNHSQVMIPLSMHQHDRIKPQVREHNEVQKTSYVPRLCRYQIHLYSGYPAFHWEKCKFHIFSQWNIFSLV